MTLTRQERFALAVVALVLAIGVGVRYGGREVSPVQWSGDAADTSESVELDSRVAAEVALEERRSLPLAPGERIDPNRADAIDLERLPEVGPGLAARIAEHRVTHGPFRTLAELDSVQGVGPAVLRAVAPHLTLPPAPAPRVAARATPRATRDGPVDLNAATAVELEALPGIGPALAGRIVEWRSANGRFTSVDELQQVSGIGPRVLERLAPLVRAGP